MNSAEAKSASPTSEKTGVELVAELSTHDSSEYEQRVAAPPIFTAEEEARLWRKIDMRLIPISTLLYFASYLDRGNIGNAKLQGLLKQLDLTGNRYNIALTMFYLSYCICNIPANLVLKKLRPSRWLPGITLAWGIIATLMGLVKTYPQLVGVRLCLGIAEAGLSPGIYYFLSMWYPRYMLQWRFGLFWGGATFSGAFSGLLAYAISFMSGTAGLLGWSWIFIIEGLLTIAVATVAFFVFVDLPATASFLTPKERAFVIHRLKSDNSFVGEEEHFHPRQILDAMCDWKVISGSVANMAITVPLYGSSLFLPSIINGFGYDAAISQLLTVPPYVIATLLVVVSSFYADRIKMRSPIVSAGLVISLIGFCINISDASVRVKYFGIFLVVSGAYGCAPAIIAWVGNNTLGHYKRGVAIGMQVMFGNIGGLVASNIYRVQDAPRYILGHGAEIAFIALGLILVPGTTLVFVRLNARRDAEQKDMTERGIRLEYTAEELKKMGDMAPGFRYTL
ncbi:MFS general substrate transporter [Trametes elegans]|nr:MFS general substrate transporter [Trametes elegans]